MEQGGEKMSKGKTISDEELIAALLQHGTIREASEVVGLTPRAIYDRMDKPDFRAMYMEAKNDILRNAVFSVNEKLGGAINVVDGIMNNQEVNPAIRLQAAQVLINNAAKFTDRLSTVEKESREIRSPFYYEI